MKTSAEIRQANLDTLITEAGGIPFLAARYDCTPAFLKALSERYKDSASGTPKGIGDKVARRLEAIMHKERGWMDHEHQHCADSVAEAAYDTAAQIHALVRGMSTQGQWVALGAVQQLAAQYPAPAVANADN